MEDFAPTAEEQELYDRVSEYLRREDAYAIPMARRALFVLVYRKILASSTFALAATLDRLADTLDQKIAGVECTAQADLLLEMDGFAEEVEELFDDDGKPARPKGQAALRRMNDELGELRACARLARTIQVNAKGGALVRGLDRCFTVAKACGWPEKAVVFTEFRRTQHYLEQAPRLEGLHGHLPLRRRLRHRQAPGAGGGVPEPDADPDHDRGRGGGAEPPVLQPGGELRPALEPAAGGAAHRPLPPLRPAARRAGAELPEPHNAADARLYDLLSQKLGLFDGVFGSSDEILGALGTGIDFEKRVLDIYQSCRSGARKSTRRSRRCAGSSTTGSRRATRPPGPSSSSGSTARCAGSCASPSSRRRRRWRGARPTRRRWSRPPSRRSRPPAQPALPEGPASGRTRRSKLVQAAAEKIRARPADAVAFLELPNRLLPATLGSLAGREGWWFAYKYTLDALVSEERVVHLVLWFDGERFHALPEEEAEAFAALPAEETQAGPRGATASIGEVQEEALAALHARLLAGLQERIGSTFDAARDRWDRSVEDGLAAPRKAVEDARAAWGRARAALGDRSELLLRDRRALLERAERDYRRRLDDLRAQEAQRYAEKDRAIAELKKRSEVKERRTLVATAYWRCT